MMDFFEALRERTIHKLVSQGGYEPIEGIDYTIEALKEMMVGEPITGKVYEDGKLLCPVCGDWYNLLVSSDLKTGDIIVLLAFNSSAPGA